MLIQQKKGNLNSFSIGNRIIDRLPLEWYETQKRILHKRTESGKEVSTKFLGENQNLTQDDILHYDEETIIAIEILPCDAIVIRPKNMFEMASICYEIGNKHLPLFFDGDEVLVVFEQPLFRLLSASGYEVERGSKKLISPLKTTVAAHGENGNSDSLFSKIMKLTNSSK